MSMEDPRMELADRVEGLYRQCSKSIAQIEYLAWKVFKEERDGMQVALMRHEDIRPYRLKKMEELQAAQQAFTPEQHILWQQAVNNDLKMKKRAEDLLGKLQDAVTKGRCQNAASCLQKERYKLERMMSHLMTVIEVNSTLDSQDLTEIHQLLDVQHEMIVVEQHFQESLLHVHETYVRELVHKMQQEACFMQLILEERETQMTRACRGQANPGVYREEERIRRHQMNLVVVVHGLKQAAETRRLKKHDLERENKEKSKFHKTKRNEILVKVEGPAKFVCSWC